MWKIKKLNDICEIRLGKTPSRGETKYWDKEKKTKNVWLSIADLKFTKDMYINDSKEYITDAGAALFNPVVKGTLLMSFKLTIGRLAFAERTLWTNEAIVALPIKNKNIITKEFLYYALASIDWDKLTENDMKLQGRTLNKKKLALIEISLPPLDEQKRIIAKLDVAIAEIDTAIAAVERNKINFSYLSQKLISKEVTWLMQNHKHQNLLTLTEKITKGSSPKWQGIKYVENDGILFVTSENIGSGEMLFDKKKYVETKFNVKAARSILKKGDVLTNIVGASIGRTSVFGLDISDANINQAVCLIRTKQSVLNPYFLSFLLNSKIYLEILHGGETSMARANLSLSFFSKLKIPVPSLLIQDKFINHCCKFTDRVAEADEICTKKKSNFKKLKPAILAQELQSESS